MNILPALPGKRLAALACCAAGLLLGGCAVNTTVADPLKASAQATGVPVAVSITANTDEISGFDTIKLRRVAEGEKPGEFKLVAENLVMKKVARGLARDTSLFIGALPPGEYEFVELIDISSNKLLRVYSRTVGSFKVEAGKPTDLGRLVVTRANLSIDLGRSARVVSNGELIRRFAPEYSKLFGADAVPGWKNPRDPRDAVEEFARAHPAGAECVTEMPDGRVVAASRMGAVLQRSTQGVWSVLNSPSTETLACLVPVDLPDAELLAVGEFGTMLRKPRDSDQLLPVDTGNLPPGNLLRIGGNDADGWYVMHRNGDQMGVFHSRRLAGGDWQSVRQFKVPRSYYYAAGFFWAWQDGGAMGYAMLDGRIAEVDYGTGKWSERNAPRKAKLASFRHWPDGTESVLIQAGLMGRFPDAYISRDRGRNWTQIVSPFKVLMSPAVPLRDGRLLLEAGMYNKKELHVSADQGKTWTPYADYALHGDPMMFASGLALNVREGYSGIVSIHSSSDDARTWKLEHSNFDVTTLVEQLKK